jgi:hypothetical protein
MTVVSADPTGAEPSFLEGTNDGTKLGTESLQIHTGSMRLQVAQTIDGGQANLTRPHKQTVDPSHGEAVEDPPGAPPLRHLAGQ